ncbi:bifunctional phosphopantothenoylcysteine decarboxylase/phosphopantothenate--cysteine ligase CoaBC [Anaerococcus sp. NML200574]|uniref:bifunctional phosphopantothenoylcysteine decarboxylase/phosphopantothenate--cysteine ligase CoaBC n=1 Tax=Anaerococcus sp. NML200574 TaxID=2954486 RepID=UPI002238192B|nr:bifunctional phosphopantothenoylcysteine decarboxylase/phosphopantothenate--cysteine ligase CoaBC [Anaerococcus sp. NML200574]MCW6678075.1 bifunctional phosphopantothenoylcysteine decarboxylase/phosphopantothenate--cysteine ligase CoaBC [Anaerococcus sp. NML200574]
MLKGKNILLGVSGGIAAYKVLDLCSKLKKRDVNLKIIMTKSATEFISPLSFETMGRCLVYTDLFEGHHEIVHHIELVKWADLMLIAPASANTIAKMANGVADNFLTSSYLACDKDVIIAPAMNTNMLKAKATQRNLKTLEDDGVKIIKTEPGLLACNTVGDGRMEEPSEIVDYLDSYFTKKDLAGKKIIVTAGPTIEPIDFVRYISNNSSGKMGYNIANEARKRGAYVVLISGPVNPFKVNGIKRIEVKTNLEMKNAIERDFSNSDALIMSAAPVDYRSKYVSNKKLKKTGNSLNLELVENQDIIKYFGSIKDKQAIIGFAAETDNLIENASKKLNEKNLDYIIANDLTKWGAGFDVDTNVASIISKDEIKNLDIMPKSELANKILDLLR